MTQINKFFISFLFFIILSTTAMASYEVSSLQYSEDFDYSDLYSNHGSPAWNYAGSGGDIRLREPVPSQFSSNAFGFNATMGGTGLASVIDKTVTFSFNPILVFNYSLNDADDNFDIYLANETIPIAGNAIAGYFMIEIGRAGVGTKNIVFGRTTQKLTADICNVTYDTSLPQEHEVAISIDLYNYKYSVVMDDVLLGNCSELSFVPDDVTWELTHTNFKYQTQSTEDYNMSIDNIVYGTGFVSEIGSPASSFNCDNLVQPLVYCDLFNYGTSLFNTNEWYVFTGSGSIDRSKTPFNNEMNMTEQSRRLSPKHFIKPFKVDYPVDGSNAYSKAPYTPVMSTDFDLKVLPTTEGKGLSTEDASIHLVARDENDREVFDILFHSEAGDQTRVYFRNGSDTLNQICSNCNLVENVSTNVKIVTYFSHKTEFNNIFNSSNSNDIIFLYINDTLIAENITFRNSLAHNIDSIQFEARTDSASFILDNYYVYTGIDRETPTASLYFKTILDISKEINTSRLTSTTGDALNDLGSLWWELGLRSTGSRIMFGMGVIILINLAIIGFMFESGADLHPAIFLVVTILILIFESVIQLVPAWIPITLVFIGAGLGMVSFRRGMDLQ